MMIFGLLLDLAKRYGVRDQFREEAHVIVTHKCTSTNNDAHGPEFLKILM